MGGCFGGERVDFRRSVRSIAGMSTLSPLSSAADDYRDADLGDPRRTKRLCHIVEQVAAAMDSSLPDREQNPSELEGTYRFLNNKHIGPDDVLRPHSAATVARAKEAGTVLVISDTTEFGFGGNGRKGLGPLAGNSSKGFYSHVSLCVTPDGRPLGVLDVFSWIRVGPAKGKRSQKESQYDEDRESLRWPAAVQVCAELLHNQAEAIYVMDREGDCIEWLAEMVNDGRRCVVRLSHDRRLDAGRKQKDVDKLFESLHARPIEVEREVPLSPRPKGNRAPSSIVKFPVRKMRMARLQLRAGTFTISPGNGAAFHIPDRLTLNFVEVSEVDPPQGEPPVLWRLVTTEPIDTPEQIEQVVDYYRTRWLIEEFFKCLKTGMNYQGLQLESAKALMMALAVYVGVAWRLLALRWLAHYQTKAPATEAMTATQVQVLKAHRALAKRPLPEMPNVGEVLAAVAQLGGHLPQNGEPGWLVLWRGFHKILMMEQGWLAAMAAHQAPSFQSGTAG